MSFVVPNDSELHMLRFITGNTAPGTLTIGLFENVITPGESDVVGSYTEPVGGGYSAQNLSGGSWTFATDTGVSTATHTEVTFTFTSGPYSIYGYFILDGSGNLLLAERFPSSVVTIPVGGGPIKITPILGLE